MKQISERDLEAQCTNAVKKLGGQHRKLDTGRGAKGWLDHAYWLTNGVHFIVEFKLPGEKPTEKQRWRIAWLHDHGHNMYLVDNYEDFMEILERLC